MVVDPRVVGIDACPGPSGLPGVSLESVEFKVLVLEYGEIRAGEQLAEVAIKGDEVTAEALDG